MSVIIGYPGETKESLKQTYDFIQRAEPDYVYSVHGNAISWYTS